MRNKMVKPKGALHIIFQKEHSLHCEKGTIFTRKKSSIIKRRKGALINNKKRRLCLKKGNRFEAKGVFIRRQNALIQNKRRDTEQV